MAPTATASASSNRDSIFSSFTSFFSPARPPAPRSDSYNVKKPRQSPYANSYASAASSLSHSDVSTSPTFPPPSFPPPNRADSPFREIENLDDGGYNEVGLSATGSYGLRGVTRRQSSGGGDGFDYGHGQGSSYGPANASSSGFFAAQSPSTSSSRHGMSHPRLSSSSLSRHALNGTPYENGGLPSPLPSPLRPSHLSSPDQSIFSSMGPGFSGQPFGPGPDALSAYPPVKQAIARMEKTMRRFSPELVDTLSGPALSQEMRVLESAINGLNIQGLGPNRGSTYADGASEVFRYHLPSAFIESYSVHDGQDIFSCASGFGSSAGGVQNALRGVGSAGGERMGFVWGLWWMTLEEIEEEWLVWRKMESRMGGSASRSFDGTTIDGEVGAQELKPSEADALAGPSNQSLYRANRSSQIDPFTSVSLDSPSFRSRMSSCPAGWVREEYSHPGWIPILTDRVGNYIGIDLDPPPPRPPSRDAPKTPTSDGEKNGDGGDRDRADRSERHSESREFGYGLPGQVIAFGREMDEKVVLFRCEGPGGWGRFLASFAEDLETGEFALFGDDGAGGYGEGPDSHGRDDTENSGGSSGDDEDGLGSLGYYDDPFAFAEVDVDSRERWSPQKSRGSRRTGSESGISAPATGTDLRNGRSKPGTGATGWRLRREYKGKGIIEALCERSRRRWAEHGLKGTAELRREEFVRRERSRANTGESFCPILF